MNEAQLKILGMAKCLTGFGPHDLNTLLSVSTKVTWKRDDLIFEERQGGKDMYIICYGKVAIYRKSGNKKIDLAVLAAGESFGEMGLVNNGLRSASAEAIEETLAIKINHDGIYKAPAVAAILYKNVARELSKRLALANDIILFQTEHGNSMSPLEITGKFKALKPS